VLHRRFAEKLSDDNEVVRVAGLFRLVSCALQDLLAALPADQREPTARDLHADLETAVLRLRGALGAAIEKSVDLIPVAAVELVHREREELARQLRVAPRRLMDLHRAPMKRARLLVATALPEQEAEVRSRETDFVIVPGPTGRGHGVGVVLMGLGKATEPPQSVTPTVQCSCEQGVLARVAENLPCFRAFADGVFVPAPPEGDVAAGAMKRSARARQNAARVEVLHGCQCLVRRVVVTELDVTLGDADAEVGFLIRCQILPPHLERLPVRRDGVREASAGASQVTPADRIAEAMEEQRKPGHRTIPPRS
jgi:hypothetical protein